MTSYTGDRPNGKQNSNGYPFHPLLEGLPLLEGDAFEEFVRDVESTDGNAVDILLWNGFILDGRNRYRACERLGIEPHFKDISATPEDLLPGLVLSLNVHRLHQTREQRRKYIEAVLRWNPSQSDRQVATATGTSHHTVASVRSDLEGRGQIAHVETREDTKGRSQPARKPRQPDPGPAGPTSKDAMVDGLGATVPARLRDVFGDRLLTEEAHHLARLASQVKNLSGRWAKFLRAADIIEQLGHAEQALRDAVPFAVHAACRGEGCADCRHTGYVTAWRYGELCHHGEWDGAPAAVTATDALGLPLSPEALESFAVREKFEEALRLHRQLSRLVNEIAQSPGGEEFRHDACAMKEEGGKQSFHVDGLRNFAYKLKSCQPHVSVCPWCHAHGHKKHRKDCNGCHGYPYVTRWDWERCNVPEYREAVEALARNAGPAPGNGRLFPAGDAQQEEGR